MYNIISTCFIFFMTFTGFIWTLKIIKNLYYKYNLTEKKYNDYKNEQESSISDIFPILLFTFIFRTFIFEPFQIPSTSMLPSLFVGDYILVKKFAYNIINPFNQKILFRIQEPLRGDIIIFKYPHNTNLNFVKRVIGIPGDTVKYNPLTKKISIYNKYNKYSYLMNLVTYDKFINNNFPEKNILDLKNNLIIEETNNKNNYNILISKNCKDQKKFYYKQKLIKLGTWVIPKGFYFVMGDNRDNSSDSRYWGLVPEENVLGKVSMVWFSLEQKENMWPTGIRFYRIGKIIK
ncbi:signal peptidase I [Buchnera aphidicola]|uniref:signal peptidase I n=1 Tax=Buchnera aphidicola TaxID=9 RepID=UPI002237D563|nr:signal peptidase I [Buchnera aphidicola]MCW5197675.1 signal peptidase I [Buchnera aphidicola (Chaitophorus viminalis)]